MITCYDIPTARVVWKTPGQVARLADSFRQPGRGRLPQPAGRHLSEPKRRPTTLDGRRQETGQGDPQQGKKWCSLPTTRWSSPPGRRWLRSLSPMAKLPGGPPGSRATRCGNRTCFYAQGHIWCSAAEGKIAGFDIRSGKRAKELDASGVQSPGHHLRCYRAKATDKFLITQFRGVEFLSLGEESHNQNDWLRGSCTYGIMPANGFLYAPPHSCFCYAAAMSKGLKAFAGETKTGIGTAGRTIATWIHREGSPLRFRCGGQGADRVRQSAVRHILAGLPSRRAADGCDLEFHFGSTKAGLESQP